ncbi:MAG: glycosyltransferase family 4 protein [Ignavibacteriae bacterium]|nr:glycosyltransferase family 4 protein [Ignavibacteriota bacterium]
MNILFLTLVGTEDINERGIYNDLMRKFRDEGHSVFIVSPFERRLKKRTQLIEQYGIKLLKVKTLNIQKTNIIEKGLSTLSIEYLFLASIKKHFKNIKFDLVLYSTPPITFSKIISYIKKTCKAKSYLLLKDIFPQNAVDIGLMKEAGILHKYFRKKEKILYKLSDYIGCMSPANVEYLIKHNREIDVNKIEVNPNSIEPISVNGNINENTEIRYKYEIPHDALLFLYGGNLGKPQGIDFLIRVLDSQKENFNVFFLIIGDGTEFQKLNSWIQNIKPKNVKLIKTLLKKDYDKLVEVCDVGMIFLDKRFTIPNFPSRLLSYLENKKPVVFATDLATDIGKIAVENKFGLWSETYKINDFEKNLNFFVKSKDEITRMGLNGYNYLLKNYTTNHSYNIIMQHFENVQ